MNDVYVSFGENCLSEDIISRHGIGTFVTPYSWGRSNIEYILQIEKAGKDKFLDRNNMAYEPLGGRTYLRLKKYDRVQNKYDTLCMNGFEFTHHDVLADDSQMKKFRRRCDRLNDLKGKNLFAFYHHRYCEETDRKLLLKHLSSLRTLYKNKCKNIEVILFTQVIVDNISQRKIKHYFVNGIHVYVFYTLNVWGGTDKDIFWAKCDDDLVKKMINNVKNGLSGNHIMSQLKFIIKYRLLNKSLNIF